MSTRSSVDGDAFGPFQVLHTPGHSPGHLSFWWEEHRFLVAGDAVATWPIGRMVVVEPEPLVHVAHRRAAGLCFFAIGPSGPPTAFDHIS